MSTEPTALDIINEDGPPITVADLIRQLQTFPPDAPIVMATTGPDSEFYCPVVNAGLMDYLPESPYHGTVSEVDDNTGPVMVTVLALDHRGVPD